MSDSSRRPKKRYTIGSLDQRNAEHFGGTSYVSEVPTVSSPSSTQFLVSLTKYRFRCPEGSGDGCVESGLGLPSFSSEPFHQEDTQVLLSYPTE